MRSAETVGSPGEPRYGTPPGLGAGVLSLLIANAGFIYFYFRFDLSLYQVLIVFWLECFWIGFYSAAKLCFASALGDPYANRQVSFSKGANVLLSLGTLAMVSSAFLTIFMLSGLFIATIVGELSGIRLERLFLDNLSMMFGVAGILFAGHGISFLVHFLFMGEYRSARLGTLLALPFKRCVALISAIAIAVTVMTLFPPLSSSNTFVLLLFMFKIAADYRLHLRERRGFIA